MHTINHVGKLLGSVRVDHPRRDIRIAFFRSLRSLKLCDIKSIFSRSGATQIDSPNRNKKMSFREKRKVKKIVADILTRGLSNGCGVHIY